MNDSYADHKKKQSAALKKATDEHMASMAKGFSAVKPDNNEWDGPTESSSKVLYFPNFQLKQSDIPESKNWEVGKRYSVEMMLEMTAMEARKGKEPTVRFDVVGLKVDDAEENESDETEKNDD